MVGQCSCQRLGAQQRCTEIVPVGGGDSSLNNVMKGIAGHSREMQELYLIDAEELVRASEMHKYRGGPPSTPPSSRTGAAAHTAVTTVGGAGSPDVPGCSLRARHVGTSSSPNVPMLFLSF